MYEYKAFLGDVWVNLSGNCNATQLQKDPVIWYNKNNSFQVLYFYINIQSMKQEDKKTMNYERCEQDS